MIKTLILDFDGTLADTQACIVASVQSTLNVLRLPSVPQEEIISRIGLPLRTVLTEGAHIPTGTLLEKSVDIYRQLFDEISPRTAHLFPHVKETLQIEVKDHEPSSALFTTEEDGLEFYEKISNQACSFLNKNS